jgi:hypothetical protein
MSLEQATARAARLARRIGFAVVQQRHYDGRCNVLTSGPGSDMCRHWPVDRDGNRIDYVSAHAARSLRLRISAESTRYMTPYHDARALARMLASVERSRELIAEIAREWGLT